MNISEDTAARSTGVAALMLLAALAMPKSAGDWEAVLNPLREGEKVRVSSEPKEVTISDIQGLGRGPTWRTKERQFVEFTDERGRPVVVPIPQLEGLQIGDTVEIVQHQRGMGQGRVQKARMVTHGE